MDKKKVLGLLTIVVSISAIAYAIIANEKRKKENKALSDSVKKLILEEGVIPND
jgi:hypothetical protein